MIQTSFRLLFVFAVGCAAVMPARGETPPSSTSVGKWLDAYEHAWETRDADAAAALFSDDALYFETPWAEPLNGPDGVRDYWQKVTEDQRDIDFEWELISVGPEASVAHWTASFALASQEITVNLDGVFVLRFDEKGGCTELREWWHAQ